MYTLGKNWHDIFEICQNGLKDRPNDKLLNNIMKVLMDYDKTHSIHYRITAGTIDARDILGNIDQVPEHVKNYGKHNKVYKSNGPSGLKSWF